jgi:hypothetical protein
LPFVLVYAKSSHHISMSALRLTLVWRVCGRQVGNLVQITLHLVYPPSPFPSIGQSQIVYNISERKDVNETTISLLFQCNNGHDTARIRCVL